MPPPMQPIQPGGEGVPTGPAPGINYFTPDFLDTLGRGAIEDIGLTLTITWTLTRSWPPPPPPPTWPIDLIRIWPEPDGIKVYQAKCGIPWGWDPSMMANPRLLTGTDKEMDSLRGKLVDLLKSSSLTGPFYLWAGNNLYEVRNVGSADRGSLSKAGVPDLIGIGETPFGKAEK